MGVHIQSSKCMLDPVCAHGGVGLIRSCRAATPRDGPHCHFVDITVVPPGCSIGVHTHDHTNEEVYVVIRGTATMFLDGVEITVRAGDVIINLPGGTHGLANDGPEDVQLVVIEYPAISLKITEL